MISSHFSQLREVRGKYLHVNIIKKTLYWCGLTDYLCAKPAWACDTALPQTNNAVLNDKAITGTGYLKYYLRLTVVKVFSILARVYKRW